jgi:transposase
MQGRKTLESKLFYQVTLDDLVPGDHLVRRLAKVLDLEWVRSSTRPYYSHTGKPSIDPVVLAKLMILGFLYNIPSERRLVKDVAVNLAYRWYAGYDLDEPIPHHSVLSKARTRLGERFFQELFSFVVARCETAGLIAGRTLLLDSTLVKANAATDTATTLRYRPEEYWKQLEQSESPESPTMANPDPSAPAAGGDLSSEPSSDLPDEMGQKRSNPNRLADQKRSPTDPEATLLTRPGKGTDLSYKVHFGADEQAGVITAVAVSESIADDTSQVPNLLDQHRHLIGRPRTVGADSKYGSQDTLSYLQDQGIETVIPVRTSGNRGNKFDKSLFTYDRNTDTYTCPAGRELARKTVEHKTHKVIYAGVPHTCRVCPLRSQCVSSKSTTVPRQIVRFDTPYVDRARAACRSSRGRHLLVRRQTILEGRFGSAKSLHGLARARWRGAIKLRCQALLTATILNLKKLLCPKKAKTPARANSGRFVTAILAFARTANLHKATKRPGMTTDSEISLLLGNHRWN